MESTEDASANYLEHYGIKRKSGRYPWGSGGEEGEAGQYERSRAFKSYYDEMKAKGLSDKEIADGLGRQIYDRKGNPVKDKKDFSTTSLRDTIAISTELLRNEKKDMAWRLSQKGMSNTAIAERMGLGKSGESTVRGYLKSYQDTQRKSIHAVADVLKEHLDQKGYLDVGKGTNLSLGISDVKLRNALAILRDEGYGVHTDIRNPQLGTDKLTTYRVLGPKGSTWGDAAAAVRNGQLKIITSQSDDGGHTFKKPAKEEPVSVDLKRVGVKYKEDGGEAMDGVIELRRGVEDISLGGSRYAQVRVAVNGTHYLKGMAMYADDLPAGVDIRFNTNKSKDDPKVVSEGKVGAMKPLKMANGKIDPDSPFGANTQKPRLYADAKGKQKTSPINIVNEEGKWDDWSRSLSSQMLSKQSLSLASTQLTKAQAKRVDELEKIKKMTNPVVKEKLLMEFADKADAAAVHLKAAAIKDQATAVILPMNSMRPHEIFAPNFRDGEKVVLVRHPHGGPFEIPELTVNNNNAKAKRIMGGALDAVGIHHSVAAQLSGADFDGDTVLVIPNNNRKVKTRSPLESLKNFDPKTDYKIDDGDKVTKRMTKPDTQKEMGRISNLITDMSLAKAPDDHIARAVRHSMVVIDAEKHGLNYKLSEQNNGIKQLKELYQGGSNKGASTIISRSGASGRVPHRRQLSGKAGIDPKTGEKVYETTGLMRRKLNRQTGEYEEVPAITKGKRGEFVKDARELLSGGKEGDKITADRGHPMERIYAEHANTMKRLANEARKEQVNLVLPRQSKAAKALYAAEVKSLDAKLKLALSNAPLERRAQAIAGAAARARIDANPGEDDDTKKKIRYQALEDARNFTKANKLKIGAPDSNGKSTLTDREWDAIQAGAVSSTKLREILRNADMDRVRELSTPRPRSSLTTGQIARAKQLAASGRSITDIAAALDLPRSTVADNLKAK